MYIIPNTEQLAQNVRVNQAVLQQSWQPYEKDAATIYLQPYLGNNLIAELSNYSGKTTYPSWADTDPKKETFNQLHALVVNALSRFTMYLLSPHIDLTLTEMGFVVQHNNNTTPASAQRVQNAREAFLNLGYSTLEEILQLLEKNQNTITSYTNAPTKVNATGFVRNTIHYNQVVFIKNSRLRFIELKPAIQNIEKLYIEPIISTELYNDINTQISNQNISEPDAKLLDACRRAIVFRVAAEEIKNDLQSIKQNQVAEANNVNADRGQQYLTYSANYISLVKQLLDSNPDNYPLYKNSSAYVETRTTPPFNNQDDDNENAFFLFGG